MAPVPLEDNLKAELPILSNVMVIGDKRKYLSAIFTLRTDPDADGLPGLKLQESVCKVLKAAGINAVYGTTTSSEVIKDPKLLEHIKKGIERANKLAVSAAQRIQRFILIENDFSIASELTPSLKLKRRVVYEKYAKEIESMYPADAIPSKL